MERKRPDIREALFGTLSPFCISPSPMPLLVGVIIYSRRYYYNQLRHRRRIKDQESIRQVSSSFKRSGENEIITGRYA
jgi:hypothetical protein